MVLTVTHFVSQWRECIVAALKGGLSVSKIIEIQPPAVQLVFKVSNFPSGFRYSNLRLNYSSGLSLQYVKTTSINLALGYINVLYKKVHASD